MGKMKNKGKQDTGDGIKERNEVIRLKEFSKKRLNTKERIYIFPIINPLKENKRGKNFRT